MLYSDEYLSISLPISTPCVCYIQMSTWAYPYLFLHLRMLYSDEYLSMSLPISTPCVCYIQMSTWAYPYLFLHLRMLYSDARTWAYRYLFLHLRMLYSDEYLSISLPISTPCVCYIQMSTWAYPYLFLPPAYVIFRWVLEHIPTYFYTLRMLYSDEYWSISLPISTPCVCYIQMSTWAYPYLFLHPAYVIFRWVLDHIPTYFYTLRMLYSDEYLSISLPISTPCVCYIQMSTWAYPYLFLHPAYVIFRWVLEHIPTYFYTLRMLYSDEYLSISLPISTPCVCYIQMSTWAYPYQFLHPAYVVFRWVIEHIPTYFYTLRMLYSDEYFSISLPISTPAYVIFRWVLEHIPTYFYTLRILYSDEYSSISLPISTPCVCYIQMSTWAYPYLFLHPAYVIFRWVLEHIPTYFYTCVCYIQISTWAYPYLFLHPAYVIFRWVLEHIPTYFYTLRMLYSDEYLSISLPISTPAYVIFR